MGASSETCRALAEMSLAVIDNGRGAPTRFCRAVITFGRYSYSYNSDIQLQLQQRHTVNTHDTTSTSHPTNTQSARSQRDLHLLHHQLVHATHTEIALFRHLHSFAPNATPQLDERHGD